MRYVLNVRLHDLIKIIYYLDRHDVMSFYTIKIIADKQIPCYSLSNGDKIDSGDISDSLHFAT